MKPPAPYINEKQRELIERQESIRAKVDPSTLQLTSDDGRRKMDIRKVTYRCNCGWAHTCVVFEHSPRDAKHKCRNCDRVNTVVTRASMWDAVDETLEKGQDQADTAKKTSVVIHRP